MRLSRHANSGFNPQNKAPPITAGSSRKACCNRRVAGAAGVTKALWSNQASQLVCTTRSRDLFKEAMVAKDIVLANLPAGRGLDAVAAIELEAASRTCSSCDPANEVQVTRRRIFRHGQGPVGTNVEDVGNHAEIEVDIADVANLDIGESELGLIRPSRVGKVS